LVTILIPNGSALDLLVIRVVFAFFFVTFLPGYCLVNILFLNKNRLDIVEELVLSVALTFGLDGLVGLFLGLSPIGITFTSITISLSAMVLVLAAIAFVRQNKEAPNQHIQIATQSPPQATA
jgi:uncharacterized membrane protein